MAYVPHAGGSGAGGGELTPAQRQRLERELERGERVTWSGGPTAASMRRGTIPIALFGLFFFGFAVFWTVMAGGAVWFGNSTNSTGHSSPGPMGWCFPLVGLPFLLVGGGLVASPFLAASRAGASVYALTDRRAIIIRRQWPRRESMRSIPLDNLSVLERIEHTDGSGDVVLRHETQYAQGEDGPTSRLLRVGFMGVPDVRTVERLVREAVERVKRAQVEQ